MFLPVLLAVAGGLLLAGGTTATWVVDAEVRDLEGLAVPSERTIGGVTFAPIAVPVGAAAVLGALTLPLTRGRGRLVAAAMLGMLGLCALAVVVGGTVRAVGVDGALGAGPAVAGLGGLAVSAAAALAGRRRAPLLDDRYSVEGSPDEGEWELSSKDVQG